MATDDLTSALGRIARAGGGGGWWTPVGTTTPMPPGGWIVVAGTGSEWMTSTPFRAELGSIQKTTRSSGRLAKARAAERAAELAAELAARAREFELPLEPDALRWLGEKAALAEMEGQTFEAGAYDDDLTAFSSEVEAMVGEGSDDVVEHEGAPETVAGATAKAAGHVHPGAAKTAAALTAEFRSQGHPDPVAKAREHLAGGNAVAQTIAKMAGALERQGLSPGQATVAAARAMGDVLSQRLRERAEGALSKAGPDPCVAEVAATLRLARIRKGLTQEELGELVGVSSRQIIKYEAGQALPRGLNVTRLAGALGLGVEGARAIAKARGRGVPED